MYNRKARVLYYLAGVLVSNCDKNKMKYIAIYL